MNLFTFLLLVLTVLFYAVQTEATICAPLSSFKIDCDDCQCSEDGTQYSCQVGVCGSAVYLNENAQDDNSERQSRDADVPYVNDEIPPPGENVILVDSDDNSNNDSEDKGYNLYVVDKENDAEPIADEEQSVDDNADAPIPYRLRRSYVE